MSAIILSSSLRGYFFEGLNELNQKSLCPIPQSIIYYSSDVLDKFALSDSFFEVNEGRVKEKILGLKLLEAQTLTREEQKKVYKEVADMSLMVCGYFSESVNKKLVDREYYSQIGKTAFGHLNNLSPGFLDIPCFYGMVATCFESVTSLMSVLASKNHYGKEKNIFFERLMKNESVSDKELLASGIIPNLASKVS